MMIECEAVSATYGSFITRTLKRFKRTTAQQALSNFSHSFAPGVTIILGPNGAGKSTLLQMLTGDRLPSSGRIRFAGTSIDATDRRQLISFLPQNFDFYSNLTAYEMLYYIAILKNIKPHEARISAIEQALLQTNLLPLARQIIGCFSRGLKQRLGLAQALLVRMPILILDEPSSSLDPEERRKIHRMISTLGKDRTVIFASSLLDDISCANYVIILNQGECHFAGTPAELAAQGNQSSSSEQNDCDDWTSRLQAAYRKILRQELI